MLDADDRVSTYSILHSHYKKKVSKYAQLDFSAELNIPVFIMRKVGLASTVCPRVCAAPDRSLAVPVTTRIFDLQGGVSNQSIKKSKKKKMESSSPMLG